MLTPSPLALTVNAADPALPLSFGFQLEAEMKMESDEHEVAVERLTVSNDRTDIGLETGYNASIDNACTDCPSGYAPHHGRTTDTDPGQQDSRSATERSLACAPRGDEDSKKRLRGQAPKPLNQKPDSEGK